MSSTSLEIAVVGATGAAGEQVLLGLEGSDLPIAVVRAFGSPPRSPRVDTVSFRGTVGVEPIGALAGAKVDVAVLCVPPSVAAKVAPGLVQRGIFVVDAGDATAGVLDAPLVLPGVVEPARDACARAGAVRTPSATGALLVPLLVALAPLGLAGCRGVVSRAASASGRAGMAELSQQVVATLGGQDPQRRMFPEGLAFDTLPEDASEDEWSAAEQLAATEVEALAGLPAAKVAVTLATQPLFSGITAGLHLSGVAHDDAASALSGAPGLVAVSRPGRLRPRAALGKPGVRWGRLRADPAGDGVHLWAVADELACAADSVVRAIAWLNDAGLLGVA